MTFKLAVISFLNYIFTNKLIKQLDIKAQTGGTQELCELVIKSNIFIVCVNLFTTIDKDITQQDYKCQVYT